MKVKYFQIFKCKAREDGKFHSEDAQPTGIGFANKEEAEKYCLAEGNKKIGIVYTSKPVEVEIFKTFEESQEQTQETSLCK